MADFADVVEEIKNTNKKLDVLTQTSDPSGASATEEKRDAALQNELKVGYLKTIAESVTGYKAGAGGAGRRILDECTSAVSREMEQRLYDICATHSITYVT